MAFPRFLLHCDAANGKFTLAKLGEDWKEEFASFDDAYEQAEARAVCTCAVVIFNEQGQPVLETSVSPLEPGLASAREHWRRTAAIAD